MPPTRKLRDAAQLLLPEVSASVAALDLQPEDGAAVRLALQYAETLDGILLGSPGDWPAYAQALQVLGPKLAQLLGQLGATPEGRARHGKMARPVEGGKLAQLKDWAG